MAIEIIRYNEDAGTIIEGESSLSIRSEEKPESILGLDEYTFSITSDIENASVLVNGQPQGVSTPGLIKFKKSDLFVDDERKIITVEKNGYEIEERYEIYLVSLTNIPISDLELYRDDIGITNLRDIDLRVDYYVNDRKVPFSNYNGVLTVLPFTLDRESVVDDTEKTITTIVSGDNESAVLERIGDGEVFPLTSEQQTRTDNQGARYLLKTADTSSYRIAALRLIADGQSETIFAEDGQSLTTEIVLNVDTQIEVATQRLVIREKQQPRIQIPNTSPRMLNKNEPNGIPIAILKNPQVEAISVIVGDQMIEFDDIGSIPNQQCIITIPASYFNELGSYNVKIFPYSIEQLESYTLEESTTGQAERSNSVAS